MDILLQIPADPDAPVACDMSAADDTPAERLAEYGQLFTRALIGRERSDLRCVFRFADKPGVRDWVRDLAAREAACCPFIGYEIAATDGMLTWTTSGADLPAVRAMLDEFYAAPDWVTQGPEAVALRLEDRGFHFVAPDGSPGYPFAGLAVSPCRSQCWTTSGTAPT